MLRNSFLPLAAFCLMTTFSFQLQGQSVISGDITGSVTDPSGASIPGAAIALTNLSTNVSEKTTTNAQGSYRFAFVPRGTYQIKVSASGFQNQARSGIVVTAGQPTTVS